MMILAAIKLIFTCMLVLQTLVGDVHAQSCGGNQVQVAGECVCGANYYTTVYEETCSFTPLCTDVPAVNGVCPEGMCLREGTQTCTRSRRDWVDVNSDVNGVCTPPILCDQYALDVNYSPPWIRAGVAIDANLLTSDGVPVREVMDWTGVRGYTVNTIPYTLVSAPRPQNCWKKCADDPDCTLATYEDRDKDSYWKQMYFRECRLYKGSTSPAEARIYSNSWWTLFEKTLPTCSVTEVGGRCLACGANEVSTANSTGASSCTCAANFARDSEGVCVSLYALTVCADGSCLGIDVCTQINSRGTLLSSEMWHHRSLAALWTPYEAENGVYADDYVHEEGMNMYGISSLNLFQGVLVKTCEPDFTEMRRTGHVQCDNSTIHSYTCAQEQCVIEGISTRVQFLWYGFEDGWGCFTSNDLQSGLRLSGTSFPNQLLSCGILASPGIYDACVSTTECCSFSCPPGYSADTDTHACLPGCGNMQTSCAEQERASETCQANNVEFYTCVACALPPPGQQLLTWDAQYADECRYEACLPGTFNDGSAWACTPCDDNSIASLSNAAACTACDLGTEAYTPHTSCQPCFLAPDPENMTCSNGFEVSRSASELILALADATWLTDAERRVISNQDCLRGFACLPCRPGSYEKAGVCEPCPVGSFQENFARTQCDACVYGKSTVAAGMSSALNCTCDVGFD